MTEQPKNVRLAMPSDEDEIFRVLSEKLYNENATFTMDADKVMTTIRTATRGQGGIIGVIDGKGEIAGSIGMTVSQFWYSNEWHVEEYWNFVQPEYRKSNYAKDLIDFAKWCAEKFGKVLTIGIISNRQTEAKCRLYQRKLTPMGMFFMHNLQAAGGPIGVEFKNGK